MIGALKETGFSDISLNHWSNSDGSSPYPSKSHKDGNVGDLRPLRTDFSGERVNVDDAMFDKKRNTLLIFSLKKYGWNSILSEKNSDGFLTPGTTNFPNHDDHYHIQKFFPKLIEKIK